MAFILEVVDPFHPLKDAQKHHHPGGVTIRQWLELTKPGFVEFEKPTICIINGQPVMRDEWNTRLIQKDDVVNFVAVVGYEWVVIILIVLLIALVIVMAVTMKTPETPGELPASSPVFSNQGKMNAIRLGEPIECNYGRNRIYPSLASRPFYRYVGNDQFQHSLLCIGQGVYAIDTISIGDTPIENFEEVEHEIIEPGGVPTLFSTNVITSVEAGGQTLYGLNQIEYAAPGWVGPFPANPPSTEAQRLEIDLVFPRGLYVSDKKGRLKPRSVFVEVVYRRIDDAGAPITSYSSLLDDNEIRMRTTTPQRITFGKDVTPGRYEVRMRRTNDRIRVAVGNDQVVWEGLRGFITGEEPDYGNVTLLAVKIRATNNLNSRTAEKFNVVATRKLPIRESSGTWSDPVATRSIVWAFVDVFRSAYGGRVADDVFFDWDSLETLDAEYAGRSEYFDWTFRDPITVWDAAKTIARVGRAVPLLSGSLITMRRDGPLSVPVTMFTPDNTVKGSFQLDIKLWEPNDFDSIAIEYTEPSTGYKQEVVVCTLPGGTSDHPEDIRIPGVQDRNHAYREGLFLLATKRYLRENIVIETGMEGFIPSYGDLVAVAHDVPRWAQFGYIVAVEEMSGNQFLLQVSEPLHFGDSGVYEMLLRDKRGGVVGPLEVEEMSDPQQVIITTEEDIDFLLTGKTEPMMFVFGIIDQQVKYGKVVKIEPQGGERVKITLVNNAPIIHTFDALTAPPLTTPTFPDDPDLPVIHTLNVSQWAGLDAITASWSPAIGAVSYVIEISYDDGMSWEPVGTTSAASKGFVVSPGDITVRVAALSAVGQGPWIYDTITISPIHGLTNNVPWEALEWGVYWWGDTGIDKYLIKVYDNSGSAPVLKRTVEQTSLTFVYDYDDAVADGNVVREHLFEIDAIVRDEETLALEPYELPISIELENAMPPAPTGLASSLSEINSDETVYTYHLTWTNPVHPDANVLKVWFTEEEDFDPAVTAPTLTHTAVDPGDALPVEVFAPYAVVGIHPNLYWRIGIFDVWGNEISTNVSAQQTILAPEPPTWLLAGGLWDDGGAWNDGEVWED